MCAYEAIYIPSKSILLQDLLAYHLTALYSLCRHLQDTYGVDDHGKLAVHITARENQEQLSPTSSKGMVKPSGHQNRAALCRCTSANPLSSKDCHTFLISTFFLLSIYLACFRARHCRLIFLLAKKATWISSIGVMHNLLCAEIAEEAPVILHTKMLTDARKVEKTHEVGCNQENWTCFINAYFLKPTRWF